MSKKELSQKERLTQSLEKRIKDKKKKMTEIRNEHRLVLEDEGRKLLDLEYQLKALKK